MKDFWDVLSLSVDRVGQVWFWATRGSRFRDSAAPRGAAAAHDACRWSPPPCSAWRLQAPTPACKTTHTVQVYVSTMEAKQYPISATQWCAASSFRCRFEWQAGAASWLPSLRCRGLPRRRQAGRCLGSAGVPSRGLPAVPCCPCAAGTPRRTPLSGPPTRTSPTTPTPSRSRRWGGHLQRLQARKPALLHDRHGRPQQRCRRACSRGLHSPVRWRWACCP